MKIKFFLEILIVSLLSALLLGIMYNKEYEVCANYETQAEAMKAYLHGARQLDRDKDGFPCEGLPVQKIIRYYK